MRNYPYFLHLAEASAERQEMVAGLICKLIDINQFDNEDIWGLVQNLTPAMRHRIALSSSDEGNWYAWMRWQAQEVRNPNVMSIVSLRAFIEKVTSGHDSVDCEAWLEETYELIQCDDCGDWERVDEARNHFDNYDAKICRSCIDHSYRWSSRYDDYVSEDNARDAFDEDGDECVISRNDDNFRWSDARDSYVHVDLYELEEEEEPEVIATYHSSKSSFQPQDDTWTKLRRRYLGVELEVEVPNSSRNSLNREDKARQLNELINKSIIGSKVFFENDGSLNNGFEIISQPMGLGAHKELWSWLNNKDAVKGLRSHMTGTCGLHVHISRASMSKLQIAKIVAFINDPDNEGLIRAVARRYAEGYCRIKVKKIGQSAESDDRYDAVNITPRRTIEFRIFKGSLKYESVMSAIQFSNAVTEFCSRSTTSVLDLKADKFMDFIDQECREDTDILRPYLAARLELA